MTQQVIIIIGVGLMAGVLSGLFGIGGGVVIIPMLVMLLGFTQKNAQGTTLAMLMFPVVALGVWNYYRQGEVDFKAALWLGLGFVGGGYFGSKLALWLPEAWAFSPDFIITNPLKKLFALLIIVLAVRMLFEK